MKYILSSFGLNNPYIVGEVPDHAVYPIGLEGDDYIDLDYSLLLAGTGFLFDQGSLEYMEHEQRRLRFLVPLVQSIRRLKEEGFLDLFDGKAIVEQSAEQIRSKTETLCDDVIGWLSPVRSQWQVLKADRETFLKKFGTAEKRQLNEQHFSVANAVVRIDGKLNPVLLREVNGLINSRRRQFTGKEAEYVKEVLRPLVCHAVIQDLMRFKTGGAILDWDDSRPYYERLYAARWEKGDDHLLAYHARSLFTLALPELRPRNVEAVIKFIRNNRNVADLRADIADILARGEKFDAALGKRIVNEALKSELAVKRKMKKYRLLGAVLSVFMPGGSLLTEAAVEGATTIGEDAIEGAFGRPHRWFYSLGE
ncbi:MAG: hypothetical protein IT430_20585 [Phycisphaerales bacterium]|nr:hypothetical protein [Phycisphaerales bacterium]